MLQGLDALVIPGGWCPDLLRRDERFIDLVKVMVEAGTDLAVLYFIAPYTHLDPSIFVSEIFPYGPVLLARF